MLTTRQKNIRLQNKAKSIKHTQSLSGHLFFHTNHPQKDIHFEIT